jgi:hypothetical protein
MDANTQWSPYRAAYWRTVLSSHVLELTAMSSSPLLNRAYCVQWSHHILELTPIVSGHLLEWPTVNSGNILGWPSLHSALML